MLLIGTLFIRIMLITIKTYFEGELGNVLVYMHTIITWFNSFYPDNIIKSQNLIIKSGFHIYVFIQYFTNTVQSNLCTTNTPLGPQKSGRCSEVVATGRVRKKVLIKFKLFKGMKKMWEKNMPNFEQFCSRW